MPSELIQRARPELPALQQTYSDAVSDILGRLGEPGSATLRVTQSKTFILPDGTEQSGPIPMVLVDFVAENRYYLTQFNPNAMTPPDCAALSPNPTLLAPFEDSPTKQCDTCTACPQNAWGSSGRGQGKACTNGRLIALLDPLAPADSPLIKLRISPTGITPFEAYVRQLGKTFNKPIYSVITYIGFDPQSTYSSLRFGDPTSLENTELSLAGRTLDGTVIMAEALERQAEARELLMRKPDFTVQAAPVQNSRQAPAARGASRRAAA